MERVGIFFRLKQGKKQAYIKRHDEIWPEITQALEGAGISNFSIWNEGDMLFSYYEVEEAKKAEELLGNSEIYTKWRADMEEYIYIEPQTGQKEWFLQQIFLHE